MRRPDPVRRRTSGRWPVLACVSRTLVLACASRVACDGPPDRTPTLGDASVAAGRQLVADKGCVACHTFPDVKWPRSAKDGNPFV